ncbi:MAG: hypothetical protein HYT42_01965 [Candidatus Sungbacteria bacterium]|nr:hypothetical protein [Candidatus Sungbacteria bacterium]
MSKVAQEGKFHENTCSSRRAREDGMDAMKILVRDVLPCWYELSWDASIPAIFLMVHADYIAENGPIPTDHPNVEHLGKEFQLPSFSGDFGGDFGFGAQFRKLPARNGFARFRIEIPNIRKQTGKRCPDCRGTAKDHLLAGRACFECRGTGMEHVIDWHTADVISATFTVFTMQAEYYQGKTSAPFPQLLTVSTSAWKGTDGGSLHGMFGILLCRFLRDIGEGVRIPEMEQAMQIAHRHMLDSAGYDTGDYRARVERRGWLNVSCPGSGCGLHPAHELRDGCGYEFTSHNVDSPAQQLTLLAGLAALHDRARRELRG